MRDLIYRVLAIQNYVGEIIFKLGIQIKSSQLRDLIDFTGRKVNQTFQK